MYAKMMTTLGCLCYSKGGLHLGIYTLGAAKVGHELQIGFAEYNSYIICSTHPENKEGADFTCLVYLFVSISFSVSLLLSKMIQLLGYDAE